MYCMNGPHCVYSLILDGHLGCFHLLTVVNSAAVNMGVQVLFEHLLSILLGVYPAEELLGHVEILCLTYRGTAKPFCVSNLPG